MLSRPFGKIDASISKRTGGCIGSRRSVLACQRFAERAAIIHILYSVVWKVAIGRATWVDWNRASMGAQRAKIRPRSPGNGRRETTIAPEERRSSIVGRHSRRPFTVHCLAFVPPVAIPCTSQHAFAESLLLSADSLSLSCCRCNGDDNKSDVRAPPINLREINSHSPESRQTFGFRCCLFSHRTVPD